MELGNVTRSFAKRIVGGNVETLAKLEAGRLPKATLLKKADRGMIALVFVEDEGFKIVKVTSSKAVIQSKGMLRVTDGNERFDIRPSEGYAVEEEAPKATRKTMTSKPAPRKPAVQEDDEEGFEPGQIVYIVSDELKPIKGEVVETLRNGKIVVETAEETAKLDADEVYLTRAKAKAACAEIAAEMDQEDEDQEEDQNEDEDEQEDEPKGSGLTADDFEVGQTVYSALSAGDRVYKGEVQKVNRKTVAVLWETDNEFREPFSGVYLKKSLALKA